MRCHKGSGRVGDQQHALHLHRRTPRLERVDEELEARIDVLCLRTAGASGRRGGTALATTALSAPAVTSTTVSAAAIPPTTIASASISSAAITAAPFSPSTLAATAITAAAVTAAPVAAAAQSTPYRAAGAARTSPQRTSERRQVGVQPPKGKAGRVEFACPSQSKARTRRRLPPSWARVS